MNSPIILVLGTYAHNCAVALAATDGVALAAHALDRYRYFTPLRPVVIHAHNEDELKPWMGRATAVLSADDTNGAVVLRGRISGTGRGRTFTWGAK